jgi:hypothetical protein
MPARPSPEEVHCLAVRQRRFGEPVVRRSFTATVIAMTPAVAAAAATEAALLRRPSNICAVADAVAITAVPAPSGTINPRMRLECAANQWRKSAGDTAPERHEHHLDEDHATGQQTAEHCSKNSERP